MIRTSAFAASLAALSAFAAVAVPDAARGQVTDVILGELLGARVYARQNGIAAMTVGTTSCNAGDKVLEWKQLPDNRHPVITQNLYRLLDGRMTQIGQSWGKHGFVALQQNVCNFGCATNPSGDGLGVGCSDPYGAGTNQGPRLGSRRLVNPVTGHYDGQLAMQELNAFRPASPVDHGLQVRETDLAVPGARYFIEGQYIAADDSLAGNGNNNVSHMEINITRDAAGNFLVANTVQGPRPTVREMPAIRAWPYADFSTSDNWPEDGRIIVASKPIRMSRTTYRYEYAIYNMNSERGVRSFTIPIGTVAITNVGTSAVFSHGEPFANTPWEAVVENGRITWSTTTFQTDANANAIRWGTTYNFWLESTAPPAEVEAVLGRFKSGIGPPNIAVRVQGPKLPTAAGGGGAAATAAAPASDKR